MIIYVNKIFWLSGKEPSCNARDLGLIPGLGRSSGEVNGYPLQYFYLKNSMDRGARWAAVYGVSKESDTTKRLTLNMWQKVLSSPPA